MEEVTYQPTVFQKAFLDKLFDRGYSWDKGLSIETAGVAMIKGTDLWLFSLDGEIVNDPKFVR